jgi:hypothetical protein
MTCGTNGSGTKCAQQGGTEGDGGHSNAVAVNGSRRQMNTKQVGCMASCPERKLATAHQEVAIGATQSAIKRGRASPEPRGGRASPGHRSKRTAATANSGGLSAGSPGGPDVDKLSSLPSHGRPTYPPNHRAQANGNKVLGVPHGLDS